MGLTELCELVSSMKMLGWDFRIDDRVLHIDLLEPPLDNRHLGERLEWFGDYIYIDPSWDRDMIIRRVFVTLQYLRDHELREEFTIGGERPFEAHDPPVTGYQKEWFVERESALQGY